MYKYAWLSFHGTCSVANILICFQYWNWNINPVINLLTITLTKFYRYIEWLAILLKLVFYRWRIWCSEKVIQISLWSKFQQCVGSYGKCRDDKDMEKWIVATDTWITNNAVNALGYALITVSIQRSQRMRRVTAILKCLKRF